MTIDKFTPNNNNLLVKYVKNNLETDDGIIDTGKKAFSNFAEILKVGDIHDHRAKVGRQILVSQNHFKKIEGYRGYYIVHEEDVLMWGE